MIFSQILILLLGYPQPILQIKKLVNFTSESIIYSFQFLTQQ